MRDIPTKPPGGKPPVPVYEYRNEVAEEAYAVYSALAKLAVSDPALGHLPLMSELRELAYARFIASFEAV
jgi:hypothetical protein